MSKKKGFRDGKTPDDYLELTDSEKDTIEKHRKLGEFKLNTIRWKVALMNDNVRRIKVRDMKNIELRLMNMENTDLSIERMEEQIDSGEIFEELRDGVTMTKDELTLQIRRAENMMWADSKDIINDIVSLSSVVGCTDVTMKNIIMTEEEFDKYVREIEDKIQGLGYELFDEFSE